MDYPDRSICQGDIISLNISEGVAHTWVPSTGLDDPFSANPNASPTETTTYTVTITNSKGCTATDQITITVENCTEDSDGDGIINTIELELGTNPDDPCSNNYSADELCNYITNNPNLSLIHI